MVRKISPLFVVAIALATPQLSSADSLDARLLHTISDNVGAPGTLLLPNSDNIDALPADPSNPITRAKVKLGKLLYHETGVGTATTDASRTETYSCATCHHAEAGFKAGIKQGIADGGVGFSDGGTGRVLGSGMNIDAPDGDPNKPDVQPLSSPTVLNVAYQDVMLWNGSFGNTADGINAGLSATASAGPPDVMANKFGLSGVETQVLAGTRVHRLNFDNGSYLQTIRKYRRLYNEAFPDGDTGYRPPGSSVTPEALGAAKAIAAFERTVVANRAPFQKWLKGKRRAMTDRQLRGGIVFFGKAGCVDCHNGPALSSAQGATADEMFFSIGFDDFDPDDPAIHLAGGEMPEDASLGRGGFTGKKRDNFKFKVPQLYNLKDTNVFGHGASFDTVREVVEYKNRAIPQKKSPNKNKLNLAPGFRPLGLTQDEMTDLTAFIEEALYDPKLSRYEPKLLPTGNCLPAADFQSVLDLGCININ